MRSDLTSFLLVFSYGSFLLTFPNFGPVSLKIIETFKVSSYTFFSYFYIFHIGGIIFSLIFLDRVENRIRLLKIAVSLLIAFAFLATLSYLAVAAVGFLMGIFVVTFGSYFARFVEPWKRGRIFAVSAFMSNIYLYLFMNYVEYDFLPALILVSVAPLMLIYTIPEMTFEKVQSNLNRKFVYFSLPVFVFYLIGGVMYGIMEEAFRKAGITTHILFYAVIIVFAGLIYDLIGRKSVAIAGLLAISASLLLFPSHLFYSAHLIQSSYAFVDVFGMVIWADLSRIGSEAKQYGIGMLFIVVPIYMGFILSSMFPFEMHMIIAITLLVLSAFVIGLAEEPTTTPTDYMMWVARR